MAVVLPSWHRCAVDGLGTSLWIFLGISKCYPITQRFIGPEREVNEFVYDPRVLLIQFCMRCARVLLVRYLFIVCFVPMFVCCILGTTRGFFFLGISVDGFDWNHWCGCLLWLSGCSIADCQKSNWGAFPCFVRWSGLGSRFVITGLLCGIIAPQSSTYRCLDDIGHDAWDRVGHESAVELMNAAPTKSSPLRQEWVHWVFCTTTCFPG